MNVAFFVTGHGRSGTMWLARLLNASPGVRVHHEPIRADAAAYAPICQGEQDARKYLERRADLMQTIWERNPKDAYGEVNSYLRYMVPALRGAFDAPVAGLVRNGKHVVRSMQARGIYSRPGYPPVQAPGAMKTALEKTCWYWAETYRRLIADGVPLHRLEDLNRDRAAYVRLCEDLRIRPVAVAWERAAGKPVNATAVLPPWGEREDRMFAEIAGTVYRQCGYG